MPNRLSAETSPYLLQHQHNPVDWWPWGEAAFAEARKRDVPVFLSVGYSTCYWCHVMERQVFESQAIAQQMNDGFVNIKVDREERPDVDEHYMTATQVLTGQGGWPMSVFMTPGGAPFFAGTYFPPDDSHGRPGFPRVLAALEEAWRERREDIGKTTQGLGDILEQLSRPNPPERDVTFDDDLLLGLIQRSAADYDPRFGGFGGAPKFPRQTLLEMLLAARAAYGLKGASLFSPANDASQSQDASRAKRGMSPLDLDKPLRHTLDAMAGGGIRDHLGGGFHRYSTDAKWLVPHFEIMLYDQAMLASVYAEASRQFGEDRYARVARGVLDFVLREMTDDGGAFYTAFDAEVDAKEGGNYLWTPAEVEEVLGQDNAAEFNAVYGLDQGFNFADPHGPNPHTPDSNVLFLAEPGREDDPRIAEMRSKLLAARAKRKQPLLDTKILTSWNGLMIRAFADAGRILAEPRYVSAAEKAANWLLRHHRSAHGGLIRSSREGRLQPIDGFLDDYAFLARGFVALHRATGNDVWRDHAAELADYIGGGQGLEAAATGHFADESAGGYWFSDTSRDELGEMTGVRRKVGADSPLPSGNAAAAMLMLELDRPDDCRRTLEAFAGQIVELVGNTSALLEAAIGYVQAHGPFNVAAGPQAVATPAGEAQSAVQVTDAEWTSPDRLSLTLRIAEPFHLQAADSEQAQALALSSPHEAFDHVESPLSVGGVYRGEVTFMLAFARPVSGEAVEVSLRYQACDETRCLMPVSQAFEVRPAG